MHGISRCAALLCCVLAHNALADTVKLSDDEAKFMKQLMAKDKLINSLPKAQNGLAALNSVASALASGPITIVLAWDQAAIKTWRIANSKLDKIKKASICDEINLRIADEGPNKEFFEQLYQARGCPL